MNINALNGVKQKQLTDALNTFYKNFTLNQEELEFNDIKDKYSDGVIKLCFTTYGDNDEYDIQINFNLNKMRYEEYINDELFYKQNEVYDRTFDEFIDELESSSLEDMIRICALECISRYDIERKFNYLNAVVGDQEYMRALWFIQRENIDIDRIIDSKGNYNKDLVDQYYQTNQEPTDDTWSKYLTTLNTDINGIKEFMDSLNMSKDGSDIEKDNNKRKHFSK